MTWTKLGDDWTDEAAELTDAEHRTHVDALVWSNRRGLDLQITTRDLRRFAETGDPDTAAKGLVAKGWWRDDGDSWYIGVKFPDWQLEREVVEARRKGNALRVRRHRLHAAGIHRECIPANCPEAQKAQVSADASADVTRYDMDYPGRVGAGVVTDVTVKESSDEQKRDISVITPIGGRHLNGRAAFTPDYDDGGICSVCRKPGVYRDGMCNVHYKMAAKVLP